MPDFFTSETSALFDVISLAEYYTVFLSDRQYIVQPLTKVLSHLLPSQFSIFHFPHFKTPAPPPFSLSSHCTVYEVEKDVYYYCVGFTSLCLSTTATRIFHNVYWHTIHTETNGTVFYCLKSSWSCRRSSSLPHRRPGTFPCIGNIAEMLKTAHLSHSTVCCQVKAVSHQTHSSHPMAVCLGLW